MAIDQLLLFIAAGLLLNLTPGPDVLYIVTHALKWGARGSRCRVRHHRRLLRPLSDNPSR